MANQPKKYKKFVATAATATLVASAIVPVASAAEKNFTDISGYSADVQEAINSLAKAGIINGTSDTTFSPGKTITRGQVVKMLGKWVEGQEGFKAPTDWETKERFSDLPTTSADKELLKYAAIAKDAGVFAGSDGKLLASNKITRENMALVLDRAYKSVKGTSLVDLAAKVEDKKVADLDTAKKEAQPAIQALKDLGITTPDNFNPKGDVTRANFAAFLHRTIKVDVKVDAVAPVIKSVSAINATTATVTFEGALPEGADFNNFEINGGLVVTDAKISADRKSATLTFNRELTRNQEYTVTVTGFKDAEGKPYPDATGKFTWEVAEGVTVALDATALEQGEVTGLTVKDAAGKDVKDATVNVRSYNTNLVKVTNPVGQPSNVKLTAEALAGTTDIEVITSLADGTVLTNTFKVTVKEAVTSVANKGYTLLAAAPTATDYKYDNTTAFSKFGKANTNLVVGDTKTLVAFTETNGNPDAAPIDFTGATVKTSNGVVATAVVANGQIEVTGNAAGTATLTVTLNDAAKTKKTFAVTVTAEPKLTEVLVDATTVKLSDEKTATSLTEGVTEQTVTVNSIDQFKEAINFGTTGKVTVSTSTNGLVLGGTLNNDAVTGLANNLDFGTTDEATFTIGSTTGTPITNGKVTVSYFAKATDTKPTATKVITVNVVDVDATVTPSDIDVVAPKTEIDANAKNTPSTTDVDTIDFTDSKAFLLDAKGNRIGTTTINGATLATASVNDKTVGINATDLIFSLDGGTTNDTAKVLTYGRNAAGTVNVNVTNGAVTKTIAVKYKNSAVLPNKATVATTPVSIKVPTGTAVTLEDIIFGSVDLANTDAQLLTDTVNNVANSVYGTSKTAKNAGYEYNKPVVSFTGTDNAAFNIGTGLYGSTLTDLSTSANLWNNAFQTGLQTTQFAVDGFDVEFAITNVVKTTNANLVNNNVLADSITLPAATDYATFTLVVKGIYLEGAPQANAEQKAANNLLASPVQVNVNVSAK